MLRNSKKAPNKRSVALALVYSYDGPTKLFRVAVARRSPIKAAKAANAPRDVSRGPTRRLFPDMVLTRIFEHHADVIALGNPGRESRSGIFTRHRTQYSDGTTLPRLALVSHRFYELAVPLLYRHIGLQPHWLVANNPGVAIRMLERLQQGEKHIAQALAHTQSLQLGQEAYKTSKRAPPKRDFRPLLAACPRLKGLELIRIDAASLLGMDEETGRGVALPELHWLDIDGGTTHASRTTAVFLPGFDRSTLRTLHLFRCQASSLAFLRDGAMWPSLESLSLKAPLSTSSLIIDFGALPTLKCLILDGKNHPSMPTLIPSFVQGALSRVQEIQLWISDVTDLRAVSQMYAGREDCLRQTLDLELGGVLMAEKDEEELPRAIEYLQLLGSASETGTITLQPAAGVWIAAMEKQLKER